MPIGVAEAVAVVRLTWEAFLQLAGFANGKRLSKAVEQELDHAWRELLKGAAADMAVVEAALARARAAGPMSASALRLAGIARTLQPPRKPAAHKRTREPRAAAADRKAGGRRKTAARRRTRAR